MLSERKRSVVLKPARDYREELQLLRARREAIDSLIASLEDYRRRRYERDPDRRKTA